MAAMIESMLGASAGSIVTVKPDYTVITDGPSNRVTEMVKSVAAPEKVVVIFDHDVPTGSPEAAFTWKRIHTFAHTYSCKFVQNVGIGYNWMMNEVVKPGDIVIGGGRHASIYGSIGALGLNVTVPELARVIEGGYYSFIVPQTIVVELKGELEGSAMDAAMTILQKLGTSAKGKVIELVGSLNEHDKAVICGMVCGTGAFTALWSESKAADVTVDLSEVVPMVKMPCDDREAQEQAAILPRSAVRGVNVNAGQIGGIAGGTIADLRKAAALMEGRKLAYGFRLSIVPATSKDYLMALNEGLIEKFIDFNAQIGAVGDRSVTWQGPGVIDKGEKLITTGLYTFDGCMGVKTSMVYSASVESVMEAATTKAI